jgi:hypothetical protein
MNQAFIKKDFLLLMLLTLGTCYSLKRDHSLMQMTLYYLSDCWEVIIVNISFPSCISLIAVSLSFVAVSIFFFSYLISVIAVYPLILSKDLNYCLGLGLKGSDYDD